MSSPLHIHVIYPSFTKPYNRFDTAAKKPWAGAPAELILHRTFEKHPHITYDTRVIGTPDINRPYRYGAKILALGEEACKMFAPDDNLNKHRGYCLTHLSNEVICTYAPIQAWEFKTSGDEDDEDDDTKDDGAEKDVARTKKSNYLFWIISDFNKLLRQRKEFRPFKTTISPSIQDAVNFLDSIENRACVIDIETRIQDHSLDCIGVADCLRNQSMVIPFFLPSGTLYYGKDTARIWRSLYKLFRRPGVTIVGHNLAFDLSILSAKYHLPIPPLLYDTMLAMHRQFPMVDKSLSHAISYYTSAPRNHKGDIRPNTTTQNFQDLLKYNAEDLRQTAAVMEAQQTFHLQDDKLKEAVDIANQLQVLTLTMSATGINIDTSKLDATKDHLRRRYEQLTRCIQILVDDKESNPNSTQQVGEYLFEKLHYPVVEVTKTGAPSTSAKSLYKLQLLQNTPLIPLVIEAKETKKALSMYEASLYEKQSL